MKARLVPLYFQSGQNAEFMKRVETLRGLLAEDDDIKTLALPVLFITSEFGTVSMWDWEIGSYLRSERLDPIAPYDLTQTKSICRALRLKRELTAATFLVFQDNPGEGFQPDIFKCFYWWEDECTQRMFDKFGITIKKKSFKEFGKQAQDIPDGEAESVWRDWQPRVRLEGISEQARNSALKVYLALKRELEQDASIRGMGINCLNESHFSDTTPCLAWNMLYEERGLIWGCEADTVSMLTKYLLHESLRVPIMMTNLYPFLLGQAALKHERISDFPEVEEPENHVLVAHCGYLGVLPQSFATEWTLRPKVLAIVDDNATAIDARLPVGPITLAKLHPSFEKITVIEGTLRDYVQYPGSDCLNGAILKVPDGRRLMANLSSHHYLLMTGHHAATIRMIATILGLEVEEL
jgi:hypothetical protein